MTTMLAEQFLAENYSRGKDRTALFLGDNWWVWEGGRWVVLGQGGMRMLREILYWYEADPTRGTIKNKEWMDLNKRVQAVAFRPLEKVPCWLNGAGPEVVAFQDRLVDIEAFLKGTPQYLPATPKWFSTKCCPFDFDPEADCPVWKETLKQWFPDDEDSVALLQEWMGYLLSDDTRAHKMMLLWGPPRSGKSLTIKVINAMLGRSTVGSATLKSLGADFHGHLLGLTHVALGDARLARGADRQAAMEFITKVTGGDPVDINRKHKDATHELSLPIRFTMACNDLPELNDGTGALKERLLVLKYQVSFVGRTDPDRDKALLGELPGIAMWALEGLGRLRANGLKFTEGLTSREALMEFADRMNPVESFVQECLTLDAEGEEDKDRLYQAYVVHARGSGVDMVDKTRFFTLLYNARPNQVKQTRPREGGQRTRKIRGVRLRADARTEKPQGDPMMDFENEQMDEVHPLTKETVERMFEQFEKLAAEDRATQRVVDKRTFEDAKAHGWLCWWQRDKATWPEWVKGG